MPISVEVDTREIFLLTADLNLAADGIKERIADVMQASGPTFVRTAKQIVPVDTGALKRSIHFTVARREPRLRIGPTKRVKNPKSGRLVQTYAGYVHDGTRTMPGRPFIWDSVKRHTTAQGNFMRGIRKAGVATIDRSTGGLGSGFGAKIDVARATRRGGG